MIEIALQKRHDAYYPYSTDDAEKSREYRDNQIVVAQIKGVKKERSYRQLKLYFGLCEVVANNLDDPMWNMKNKVDFQCRVATHFVDPDLVSVRKDGTVVFSYRSISFKNLPHIQACNYFNRAFEIMAKRLGVPVDDLMKMENGA